MLSDINKTNHISELCKKYFITNYTINADGSIDVDGDVDIGTHGLTELPLKFNIVTGNFKIEDNYLTSLYGCPKKVGGNFDCHKNSLTTLEFSPTEVGGHYSCHHNSLVSLVGCPKYINGNFYCFVNFLTNLKDAPIEVNGDCLLNNNQLINLENAPTSIGGYMHIGENPLINLIGCPQLIKGDLYLTDTLPTLYSGDTDCEVKKTVYLQNECEPKISTRLPQKIIDNHKKLRLILKYQRYFEIWNSDLSFNETNFDNLMHEINDGLL